MDAASRRLREDSPTVDAALSRLRELQDPDADLLLDFAGIFLRRAPEDLLRQRSPADLATMTLGAFRFLRSSRAFRVDVEVENIEDGAWCDAVTVIRTNVSERPFIIDSIREYLAAEGLSIERMVYPMLDVERNVAGEVVRVGAASDGGTALRRERRGEKGPARGEEPQVDEAAHRDLPGWSVVFRKRVEARRRGPEGSGRNHGSVGWTRVRQGSLRGPSVDGRGGPPCVSRRSARPPGRSASRAARGCSPPRRR